MIVEYIRYNLDGEAASKLESAYHAIEEMCHYERTGVVAKGAIASASPHLASFSSPPV
jgi:hypothetical protein